MRRSKRTHSSNRLTMAMSFSAHDPSGQLTMRNLDTVDMREKLATCARFALLAPGTRGVPRPDRPDPAG